VGKGGRGYIKKKNFKKRGREIRDKKKKKKKKPVIESSAGDNTIKKVQCKECSQITSQ